ncbi:MAG: ATP-binding cassette subfamily B protein [Acidimicrobiales bacterium]|jgi:ATP-binding cassette subfamily B protein
MNKQKTTTVENTVYIGSIPNTPMKFMWVFSMKHRKWVIAATLAVIVAATLVSATNLLYKYVVDNILSENFTLVTMLILAYPVLVYVETLFWRLSGFMGMIWVTRMEYDTYNALTAYVLKHSHGYFVDRFAGSLLSKVDNVVDSATNLAMEYLWSQLEATMIILMSYILIFRVDFTAGILSMLLLAMLIIVNKNIIPKQGVLSRKNAETYTILRGHIVDTFTNITAVRHHASSSHEEKRLRVLAENSRITHANSWFNMETTMVINMTIVFVFSLAIMYILSLRYQSGLITAGDLILILAIFSTISGTLIRLGRAFNHVAKAYGKMQEGLSELAVNHEIQDTSTSAKMELNGGCIDWKNVTFEFGANTVFDEFMLSIEPGQRVGLVGPSGAGKTTFVSLLLRQHEIHGGSIEIDGQNIAEVTQDSLRANIAVVPQEPLLFHRTIKENIAYGNPDATQEEIEEVAKKAQAHEFIMKLELGYDTMVGERGIKLSGGQKQRVAIARAMLKDVPILVLDEATSALDSESEVEIQKALHILMEGKTVIAVAHRLSTLREMDRILVLETGKIVEDGTHDELAQSGGTYQRLWEHQAGGFLTE